MPERHPFRRRKSVVFQPAEPAPDHGPADRIPLPKARTAREFAFRILDEHYLTREFVSDLIDHYLDRPYLSVMKRPPLKNFLGKTDDAAASKTDRISSLDRRFITELSNGVIRRMNTVDTVIRSFITRPQERVENRLWTLLQIGVYQLLFMTSVPVHAAVGETVELAHFCGQPQWAGFLNGVLRSISREITQYFMDFPARDRVPVQPQRLTDAAYENRIVYRTIGREIFPDPVTETHRYIIEAFSLPKWLVDRWATRFSSDSLLKLAEWFAARQPLTLRVNRIKTTRDALLAEFEDKLVNSALGCFGPGRRPESIWYDGPVRIVDLPGFADGLFTVQDETAMSAAELLAPKPGEQVLDLCAAPGTKTTHMAELMNNEGHIVATDIDADRLQRVTDNAHRLGLTNIEPVVIPRDSTELPYGPFDGILIDVPCSNTGVLGKRPEVRARLQAQDLIELSIIQMRLLRAASTRVKPGGRIVYSTCSIEVEENYQLVQRFLEANSNFSLVSQTEFIPGQPTDGGFQALLRRQS